ncbi:hypothetical protein F4777DRAFT_562130 [Nemania sp. FL0916]|nr:hypothetical protein F4777DRAFT_562130 [Nemania sp. FL0916]
MFNDVSQRDCDPHRSCRVQRYSLRESSQSVGTLPRPLNRFQYIDAHSVRALLRAGATSGRVPVQRPLQPLVGSNFDRRTPLLVHPSYALQ